MKKILHIVTILIILTINFLGCTANDKLYTDRVITSDCLKIEPMKSVELFTSTPYSFDFERIPNMILSDQYITMKESNENYVLIQTESSVLSIDYSELLYKTNDIEPIRKIFQYSNRNWYSKKELAFKKINDVDKELRILLSKIGINVELNTYYALDKESIINAKELLLVEPMTKEYFANVESEKGYDNFSGAYYFEYDIYFEGLTLNDIGFYNPERYQVIPPSKVCVFVSDDGLQYLNIYGAMSPNISIGSVNPIPVEQAIQSIIDKQSRLINIDPITISSIKLKYVAIKRNANTITCDTIPVWAVYWNTESDSGCFLIDAMSGLEIV